MSKPIIEVRNLSKRYQLGRIGASQLRHDVERLLSNLMRRSSVKSASHERHPASHPDEFWALRDVSFDVQPGEVLGIVGRNGAGKSTLLKILSRITEPTSGEALLRGRVASLLEVGTGFHPELSGRENIYLNGAILGMRRAEITKRFDEIVAFSEVERFIETPVKRYSSGMYVRLAFAVAAHLPADILIIDEVLAVGDVRFQGRCMDKMESIAKREGRSILFVSHQLASVRRLCTRAVMLADGTVAMDGSPNEVTGQFQVSMRQHVQAATDGSPGEGTKECIFESLVLEDGEGCPVDEIGLGNTCQFRLRIRALTAVSLSEISLEVADQSGESITHLSSHDSGVVGGRLSSGEFREWVIKIPAVWWRPAHYAVHLWMEDNEGRAIHDWRGALEFQIGMGVVLRRRAFPGHTRMFTEAVWSEQIEPAVTI